MTVDFDYHDYDEQIVKWSKGIKINDKFFLITEADGYAAECSRNAAISGSVFHTKDNKMVAGSIGSVEVVLVAACAWPCDSTGKINDMRQRATVDEVREWPSRVVSELHDEIKEKSNLEETGEEDAETVQGMKDQIAKLQQKIRDIEGDKQGNSLADTMHGS